MIFIADGVGSAFGEVCKERGRSYPKDFMTIECESREFDKVETISLSIELQHSTIGVGKERSNKKFTVTHAPSETEQLVSMNDNSITVESNLNLARPHVESPYHFEAQEQGVTRTQFVTRTPWKELSVDDISKTPSVSLGGESEGNANQNSFYKVGLLFHRDGPNRAMEEDFITKGDLLGKVGRISVGERSSTVLNLLAGLKGSKHNGYTNFERSYAVESLTEEGQNVSGGQTCNKVRMVSCLKEERKGMGISEEKKLSTVRRVRETLSSAMLAEKRKKEGLKKQMRNSEIRLIRKMRENSLKEMEWEDKEKLKKEKRESGIDSELEIVRKLRRNFTGPNDQGEIQDSARSNEKTLNLILTDDGLSGAEIGSPMRHNFTMQDDYEMSAEERNGRSAAEQGLEMVRNVRSSMTFTEEDGDVFREDEREDFVQLDYQLEPAKQEGAKLNCAEAQERARELEIIRYYRANAEFSPQKVNTSITNDDKEIAKIRDIRGSFNSENLLAERRARAASERKKAYEREKELMDVRKTRQNIVYSLSPRHSHSSDKKELSDVRELRRTRSLGSLPSFTGESIDDTRKRRTWVFGGVNILPYREVAIDVKEQCQPRNRAKYRVEGDNSHTEKGENSSRLNEAQGCKLSHKSLNEARNMSAGEKRKQEEIRSGYTIV